MAEYAAGEQVQNPQRKYVYGAYVDEPLVLVDSTGIDEQLLWYHRSSLYSIIALTDHTGAVVERYAYDPYGNTTVLDGAGTTVLSSSAYDNPYRFTGRRHEDELGLYYYRSRYFDPELGRFLTRDFAGYKDGLNLYQYVGSNPVNFVDPLGAWRVWGYGDTWFDYIPGSGLIDSMTESTMEAAASRVRAGDGYSLMYNDCRVVVGIFVEALESGQWVESATVFYQFSVPIDEFSEINIRNTRRMIEHKAKAQAKAEAAHGVEGWIRFGAGFLPCADAVMEGVLDGQATVGGAGGCVMDVAGAKVAGVAGKALQSINRLRGVAKLRALGRESYRQAQEMAKRINAKICRWGNCFAAGTVVHTPEGLVPIEQVELGQRVVTTGVETLDSHPDEPVPDSTWRVFQLILQHADGSHTEARFLRPAGWLAALARHPSGRVWLDLPEMDCVGWAELASIEPCPPLETGPGQLVTATFRHSRGRLLELTVQGEPEPLLVTSGHPIWSEDRQAYVPAGRLARGERLRTLAGLAQVVAIMPRGPPQPTYNLEVQRDHVYRVGASGVLVHNTSGEPCKYGPFVHHAASVDDARKIVETQRLGGRPKRNIYQDDTPSVKAVAGPMKDSNKNPRAIEFYTEVKPDREVPFFEWQGKQYENWHEIPIEVSKHNLPN